MFKSIRVVAAFRRKKTRNTGTGVTKVPFVNSSVIDIFVISKITFRSFESNSYKTAVAAATSVRY